MQRSIPPCISVADAMSALSGEELAKTAKDLLLHTPRRSIDIAAHAKGCENMDTPTREEASLAFLSLGVPIEDVTATELARLRKILDGELRASTALCDFRAPYAASTRMTPEGRVTAIRCTYRGSPPRQAICFSERGGVSFANWASNEALAPILRAFAAWLREMAKARPLLEDREDPPGR